MSERFMSVLGKRKYFSEVFTANDTFNVPPGARMYWISMCGGGGGGAGGRTNWGGGGGGASSWMKGFPQAIDHAINPTISVTIGPGGTAGLGGGANDGGLGGDSSFGSFFTTYGGDYGAASIIDNDEGFGAGWMTIEGVAGGRTSSAGGAGAAYWFHGEIIASPFGVTLASNGSAGGAGESNGTNGSNGGSLDISNSSETFNSYPFILFSDYVLSADPAGHEGGGGGNGYGAGGYYNVSDIPPGYGGGGHGGDTVDGNGQAGGAGYCKIEWLE